MSFGKDISIEGSMSEAVEGGAGLAWRLLATLEGGSLLLATSALLAYTVSNKLARRNRTRRDIRNVLVTNTTNLLGRELKKRLEDHGCVVSAAMSGTDNVARSGENSGAESEPNEVDALVIVGAEPKENGLNGVAGLITEDVYNNLKLLESLSGRVRRGGCMAWACASDGLSGTGPFSGTNAAFDTVLQASLQHIAKVSHCEPIWVGRCEGSERAAEHVVAALMFYGNTQHVSRFAVRNAVNKVGQRVCRWLKIIT